MTQQHREAMLEQLTQDVKEIRETVNAMHDEHRQLYDAFLGTPLGEDGSPSFLSEVRSTVKEWKQAGKFVRWTVYVLAAVAAVFANIEKIWGSIVKAFMK